MKKRATLLLVVFYAFTWNACVNKKEEAPIANTAAIAEEMMGIPVFINSSPVKKFEPIGDAIMMDELAYIKDTLRTDFELDQVLQSNIGEPALPEPAGQVKEMVQVIKTLHPDADAIIFSNKMTRGIAIRYIE